MSFYWRNAAFPFTKTATLIKSLVTSLEKSHVLNFKQMAMFIAYLMPQVQYSPIPTTALSQNTTLLFMYSHESASLKIYPYKFGKFVLIRSKCSVQNKSNGTDSPRADYLKMFCRECKLVWRNECMGSPVSVINPCMGLQVV